VCVAQMSARPARAAAVRFGRCHPHVFEHAVFDSACEEVVDLVEVCGDDRQRGEEVLGDRTAQSTPGAVFERVGVAILEERVERLDAVAPMPVDGPPFLGAVLRLLLR